MIMGAGSIGLCMLSAAKAMGMRKIVVCASTGKRLEEAVRLGAYATIETEKQNVLEEMQKLHPGGSDVVIDATGVEACIQNCLKSARKGGTVALAGYGRGKMMSIRMDDIHINNLRVVGAGNNWNMHKKAVSYMAEGLIDIESFVSKKLNLEDFQEGFDAVRSRPKGFIKAVFQF